MVISQNWNQIGQDIDGATQDDQFGRCVALNPNGNILVVGAPHDNTYPSNTYANSQTTGAGCVRVYENINGFWNQIGQNIYAESQSEYFGGSVSINDNGTIIAVGAKFNSGNGIDLHKTQNMVTTYRNFLVTSNEFFSNFESHQF